MCIVWTIAILNIHVKFQGLEIAGRGMDSKRPESRAPCFGSKSYDFYWFLVIWIANSFIEQITGALKILNTEARDLWFCHGGIIQDSKNHKETAISHL